MEETLNSVNPNVPTTVSAGAEPKRWFSLSKLAAADFGRAKDIALKVCQGVLFWTLTVIGLGLVFLVLGLPLLRERQTMETMAGQMEARNLALRTDVERLLRERDALLYDAFYVEKVARRELSMSRKGEQQVRVLPASYTQCRMDAESHINTSHPVGLWRLYGMLHVLGEDSLLRQIAVLLGGAAVVAAVLLFGRGAQRQATA